MIIKTKVNQITLSFLGRLSLMGFLEEVLIMGSDFAECNNYIEVKVTGIGEKATYP